MTDDEPVTDTSARGTCTFTTDELDFLPTIRPDLADWGCSRPVWDETDSDRCVWHAEQADKPPGDHRGGPPGERRPS